MRRALRIGGTVLFTGLAVGYLVWKIDLGKTADVLRHASLWWFALAIAIMVLTVFPMALRWKWLLAAQGIHVAGINVPRFNEHPHQCNSTPCCCCRAASAYWPC